jgi:hypothetical protein
MKKILLILVGVVGLSGVSWGQMVANYSNLPATITLTNLSFNTSTKGNVNLSGTTWTKSDVSESSEWGIVTYTPTGNIGVPGENYQMQYIVTPTGVEWSIGGSDGNDPDQPTIWYNRWTGNNLTDLVPSYTINVGEEGVNYNPTAPPSWMNYYNQLVDLSALSDEELDVLGYQRSNLQDELNYFSPLVANYSNTIASLTYSPTWFANGVDSNGFPLVSSGQTGGGGEGGGEGGGGLGGAFITQAQELNVGLSFQDGEWTPAP